MYTVSMTDRARAELRALPPKAIASMLTAFGRLESWPNHGLDVRKLEGPLEGLWRVRRGDYRALFDVDTRHREILITRVGTRQRVYG